MSRRPRLIGLLLGVGLGGAVASAAETSDRHTEHGREIALKICAACHVVAPAQEFSPLLNPPAPPFAEVANRAEVTRASLRHFIATAHWDEKALPLSMPNPALMDSQIADVAAYILSLRGK